MDFLNNHTFLDNSLMSWAICLAYIVGACLVRIIIRQLLRVVVKKITSKTETTLDDMLVEKAERPLMYIIALVGFRLGFMQLSFGENVDTTIHNAFTAAHTLAVTWLLARLVQCIVDFVFSKYQKERDPSEVQVMGILKKVATSAIWILGIVTAINNVGYDVGAIIAGLGIGGLAMALAAQNTASNIFGGVAIFIDKPFRLQERIRIDGFDGTVENIGLRNTRLRTLQGTLVSIPNSKITDNTIENVSQEQSRKVVQTLGLVYETSHAQMEEAMKTLHSIVDEHQDLLMPDRVVYFASFGDFSLNISFIYYIRKGADTFNTQNIVNMDILKSFGERGLDFAFPSQTLYMKKES